MTVQYLAYIDGKKRIVDASPGGGGGAIETRVVLSPTQSSWTVGAIIVSPQLSRFYINGLKQEYGVDYTINSATIIWLGMPLRTTWKIELYYYS